MATTKTKKPVTKTEAGGNGVTMTQVNTAIKSMVKASQAFGVAAASAAVLALMHCQQHGDATGLQRLYAALGETGVRLGPIRQKALMAWLQVYSPVRKNNKSGDFGLIKATAPNYVAFDTDEAEANPFLDFIPDSTRGPVMQSNVKIAKRIASMVTKDYGDAWEGAALNVDAVMAEVRRQLTPTADGA